MTKDSATFNITGGNPVRHAVVADNRVTGWGESYSLCGLEHSSIESKVSENNFYVGMELGADRDISVKGGSIGLHDLSAGYALWVTGSRRVDIAGITVVGGGRGGVGYEFFLSSGAIEGGTVTMRGSDDNASTVSQNSTAGMDDRAMRVTSVTATGHTGWGMQFTSPFGVVVADNAVSGSVLGAYLFAAFDKTAGAYLFTAKDNRADPAPGGRAIVLGPFPSGSALEGSFVSGTVVQRSGTVEVRNWRAM